MKRTLMLLCLAVFSLYLFSFVGQLSAGEATGESATVDALLTDAEDGAREAAKLADKKKEVQKAAQSAVSYRIQLMIGIFIVTPIIMFIALHFLYKIPSHSTGKAVNLIGLILVVQATLFVVTSAASTEAMTAATGVLGGIAGYLFGSERTREQEAVEKAPSETGVVCQRLHESSSKNQAASRAV
ncbi:MAG: hypothetical protein ACL93V_12455 [Candidatus Electrothrix sp. YB6]